MISDNIIEMEHVFTRFGRNVVHEDITLSVARGEILGLVGGSGSGKTTLVREMIGLDQPSAGRVRLFGEPLDKIEAETLATLRNRCGVLFQGGALFSAFTVFENVAFPLQEYRAIEPTLIRDLVYMKLAQVGLGPEVAAYLPAELSGGMVKRAALARALALEPELLFLDEPTSGLDPVAAQTFVHHLQDLHKELQFTAVVITHDLDLMRDLCTSLAILADRRIVARGAPTEMALNPHPFVQAMFLGERGQRVFGAMAS
ncbi:ATP-binding cassette domain-containing protein [Acidiferrobacter sp.]|uniref:ABC transporter ATP-binding protein n=1 Tax=Acidiferrobacter sp. TaxID=1872107 RepID=UPI0026328E15|nr:ATP-binding cassette domain-containing protein [Acidiferrobacter sp.]